jgi:hypothetical protein
VIDKRITTQWDFKNLFDGQTKTAGYEPDVYVPDPIRNFIEELHPDPRFAYVHTIAMSAGEKYGSNLNGDIFRADELTGMQTPEEAAKNLGDLQGVAIPRFKTFEQAKFFRHHANSSVDPAYGDVPLAAWNEPMQRVELIIRICKQDVPELKCYGAPDVVAKLDRRGYISVSMGTRIHHEQCMLCKNENEFVSQRCDCLKNRMNEILPDGRLVAADNFQPRFFDISDVTIPADPIALSIQKVASRGKIARINLAMDSVEGCQRHGWARKFSEMDKQVPGSAGTVGNTPPPPNVPKAPSAPPVPTNMPQPAMKTAFSLAGDLNTLVSTCTLAGMVLSPVELAYFTSLSEPEKVASDLQNFQGLSDLSLDRFSVSLYDFLRTKFAERSGYTSPCPLSGWEPTKLAEQGYQQMADYYSYYRRLIDTIPAGQFIKAAHRNPHVRELLGRTDECHARVTNAMYYLSNAGIATI